MTDDDVRKNRNWLRDTQAEDCAARAAAEANVGVHVPGSTERVFRPPLHVACELAMMGRKR